jgi:putative endopeptidase
MEKEVKMKGRVLLSLALLSAIAGCAKAPEPQAVAPPAPALVSGIDTQYIDESVRPQDDFYKHINGKWLASTEIPADKGTYGSFDILYDNSLDQLKGIVEGLQKSADPADPDQQKIADLYASFMDEAHIESLGLHPLDAELAKIDAIKSVKEIPALMAHLVQTGTTAPFVPFVHVDNKDPSRYALGFFQNGLTLPDRDYYLLNDDKMKQAREAFSKSLEKMLTLAGDKNAAAEAAAVIGLETKLAKAQWTRVATRDPVKAYNKMEIAKLAALAPGFDWTSYLSEAGITGKADYVIVGQPSYITAFSKILQQTPLPTWKVYFRWQVLNAAAPYLSKAFVDENFAFTGTALAGIPQNLPRWKRGLTVIEGSIGEGLGKLYVKQYFPPASKERADALIKNLLAAYKADIDTLDWMSPETKQKAQEKLAKFRPKIGYPSKFRDYSKLTIDKNDLIGNLLRASMFNYQRGLDKLSKPVDHEEWGMTPQTVNAYYDPEKNEIVFPAAILQPPFFNAKADDAVNYGGVGGVIGHEISHGFDDQGSQYDGTGMLMSPPGWFTQADLDKFKAKTQALVAQYAAYEPVPGYHINGELTLGENIADNAGIAIAFKAYKLSLQGKTSPAIDGMTGEQRFFAGWAQVWREKIRPDTQIILIKADPHSASYVRGTVPESNLNSFYETFDVKEGDKMYRAPDQRITLW